MGLLKIVALITVINVRREEDAHASASLGGFEKEQSFVFNRKLARFRRPTNLLYFDLTEKINFLKIDILFVKMHELGNKINRNTAFDE